MYINITPYTSCPCQIVKTTLVYHTKNLQKKWTFGLMVCSMYK